MIISSTCPLSFPVVAHCLANRGWLRLPIIRVAITVSGIVRSTTRVSSGEIVSIMIGTPMRNSKPCTIRWVTCPTVCVRLSMSLVTRESTSPRERESKYRNGSAEILRSASARSSNAISCASFAIVRPLSTVMAKVARASATASPSSRARAAKSRPLSAVAPCDHEVGGVSEHGGDRQHAGHHEDAEADHRGEAQRIAPQQVEDAADGAAEVLRLRRARCAGPGSQSMVTAPPEG